MLKKTFMRMRKSKLSGVIFFHMGNAANKTLTEPFVKEIRRKTIRKLFEIPSMAL